jgi:hypothetical protein
MLLHNWRQYRLALCFVQLCRSCQRGRNTVANIFRADVPFEFGLFHQLRGLLVCSTQQQLPSRGVHSIGKLTDRAETGSVNRRHISQAQNDDLRQGIQFLRNVRKFRSHQIKTAPFVNPTITGRGKYFTAAPIRPKEPAAHPPSSCR